MPFDFAHWFKTLATRPGLANLEPVMRFPIDRSLCGVYDMTGSVSEWLRESYPRLPVDMKYVKGGSWAKAPDVNYFRLYGGTYGQQSSRSTMVGFRLVCRESPFELSGQ